MRGRYYSPAWHRFLNSDQGVDPNQFNQFAYVGGSPFQRIDPTGLEAEEDPNWYCDANGICYYQNSDGSVDIYYPDGTYTTVVVPPTPTTATVGPNGVTITGNFGDNDSRPDFINGSINVAIPNPWTFTLVGLTFNANYSRNGNLYLSAGPTVGKSATIVSGSVSPQWTSSANNPVALDSFLRGLNVSGALGFWGGVTGSWTPGSGVAGGAGFVSPQAGVSATYTPKFLVFYRGKGW